RQSLEEAARQQRIAREEAADEEARLATPADAHQLEPSRHQSGKCYGAVDERGTLAVAQEVRLPVRQGDDVARVEQDALSVLQVHVGAAANEQVIDDQVPSALGQQAGGALRLRRAIAPG